MTEQMRLHLPTTSLGKQSLQDGFTERRGQAYEVESSQKATPRRSKMKTPSTPLHQFSRQYGHFSHYSCDRNGQPGIYIYIDICIYIYIYLYIHIYTHAYWNVFFYWVNVSKTSPSSLLSTSKSKKCPGPKLKLITQIDILSGRHPFLVGFLGSQKGDPAVLQQRSCAQ